MLIQLCTDQILTLESATRFTEDSTDQERVKKGALRAFAKMGPGDDAYNVCISWLWAVNATGEPSDGKSGLDGGSYRLLLICLREESGVVVVHQPKYHHT
jgi:hypothetical protein